MTIQLYDWKTTDKIWSKYKNNHDKWQLKWKEEVKKNKRTLRAKQKPRNFYEYNGNKKICLNKSNSVEKFIVSKNQILLRRQKYFLIWDFFQKTKLKVQFF